MNPQKTVLQTLIASCCLLLLTATIGTTYAADLTIHDSIISLAFTGTKNYTFTNAGTGQSVTVAVTASPFSSNGPAVFTSLDGGTHAGINASNNSGNWVDISEAVEFSASLVSSTGGVVTNSVRFRIASLGVRPEGNIYWTSSSGFVAPNTSAGEASYALDSSPASLTTNYTGRLTTTGQFQLSDSGSLSGVSIGLNVTYSSISITADAQAGGADSVSAPSLSFINSGKVVLAANLGGSDLVRDGISFTGISSAANPMTNTIGAYKVACWSSSGSLNTATFGDALFGSFIWADSQNDMSVGVSGLDPAKSYHVYYLNGDDRSLNFSMNLNLTGTTTSDTNSTATTVNWGQNSTSGKDYIYLPVNVSGAESLTAAMTKNGSSSGVGFSGLIVTDDSLSDTLAAPTIDLSTTNLCGLTSGYSATGPTGMSSYSWTIDGGSIQGGATGQSISFSVSDVFSVTIGLVVSNALGQTASNSVTLPANVPPSASFVASAAVCAYSTTNTATASTSDATYAWTISNGTITGATNAQTITYTAAASGVVGLTLQVTSSAGCTSQSYTPISISALPDATITTSSNVVASSSNNVASGPGGLSTYAWTIANGTITSATNIQTISYSAGASGSVALGLAVANDTGCTSSSISNIVILQPPADPHLSTWITNTAGRYVRLYTNAAAQAAGITVSTWTFSTLNGTNVTGTQAAPVYSGIQEIYSSSNFVYVRSSAMPAETIGPLVAYGNASLYLPFNQKNFFRIPKMPLPANTKQTTPGGAIGYLVDGVQMYDIRDALSWTGSSEGMGNGYWTRDAYINEGSGFDPVKGHSSPAGAYHYHSNPRALRYLLGDHVDYNSSTKLYSESTNAVTKHSPILGWVADGYPLYGPYGYSSASNSASGIRRMLSGFVLRNGQNGTANLSTVGRTNIPPWAQRIYGVTSASGPSVASYGPLGRYLEDSDFMGDLINPSTGSSFVKGVDYDLDEYNGRWCVTPEFPNGTYAYFVTIESDGTPKYPYYIGRAYYATPVGGTVSNLTETVVTNFLGGTNMPLIVNKPSVASSLVTLTWSGIDGGNYKVESTTNLTAWSTVASNLTPAQPTGAYTNSAPEANKYYRVSRVSVANFDPVNGTSSGGGGGGGGGGTNTITMSPTSGNRNTTISVTANISTNATPPAPPAGAPVQSFTVGSLTVSGVSYNTQYQVTGSLTIPSNATTGGQTVTITFAPPPGQTNGPSYVQTNGFTIQ